MSPDGKAGIALKGGKREGRKKWEEGGGGGEEGEERWMRW